MCTIAKGKCVANQGSRILCSWFFFPYLSDIVLYPVLLSTELYAMTLFINLILLNFSCCLTVDLDS